jgi:fatty acyl-CoA reductase
MNQSSQTITIPEFYCGKSVFVTGGTGFLGKVLVEKLLRSCPGIENIYLLIRPKKGKTIDEQLASLLSSQAFDILRENNPKFLNKIVLVEGDTSKINLGISAENRELLINKVSVIFHSAATVRFLDTLKNAVNTNLRALDELIKLSRELKDLKVRTLDLLNFFLIFQRILKTSSLSSTYQQHIQTGISQLLRKNSTQLSMIHTIL